MTEIGVLVRLIEQLQRLPGIGAKGAQRLAFHLLRKPREDVDQLLVPKLPDRLTEEQKLRKVNNLLQELRRAGRIENRGHRAKPEWVLTGPDSGKGTS